MIGFLLLPSLLASLLFAFLTSPKVPTSAAKMSLDFTTKSLALLRAISDYDGSPTEHVSGQAVSDAALLDAIHAVDDGARSNGELEAAHLLHIYLTAKLKNNATRESQVHSAWAAWERAHRRPDGVDPDASPTEQAAQQSKVDAYQDARAEAESSVRIDVLSRETMIEAAAREAACRDAADKMLRSGYFHDVSACGNVEVDGRR